MIVLGSQSPRRKLLMEKDITPNFKVVVSDIDESASYKYRPLKAVKDIAYRKGQDICSKVKEDTILTADTIVVLKNEIIGKPKDPEDAKRMLHKLSGKVHTVYTAYYINHKGKEILHYDESYVKFNELSDELIDKYVASGSPLDKAGAYGLQDNNDFEIVKSVRGSIKNVIGFPSEKILKDLNKIGALE
ncbi:MAG: Maf family protein [Bacilli bacterium]|nr:Maf family protein [Bacilli bacterium]